MQPDFQTRRLLTRLRTALQGYADQHLAKEPPQVFKAETNLHFVTEINDELLRLASDTVRVPDRIVDES